jgi:glutathione S-transferase
LQAAALKEWTTAKFPTLTKGLVTYLGDKPFFFGTKPSFADIQLYVLFDNGKQRGVDLLSSVPELERLSNNVANLPQLAAYFAKRAVIEAKEKEAAAKAAATSYLNC